jgi:hypothetical protein
MYIQGRKEKRRCGNGRFDLKPVEAGKRPAKK